MIKNQDYFVRFPVSRRIEHVVWFTAFIILAVTGLPQKFHNATWAQGVVLLLGGIEFVRLIHRLAATIMILAFVYHVVSGLNLLFLKGERFYMLPTSKDVKDVSANIKYFFGLSKKSAQYGRFSYVEKFDYWAVFWGMAIMAGSGLVLWFPSSFTHYLPGAIIPISKAAHSDEALLAVLAIFLWHMYNVHFNPRIFPINTTIFTGKISKERMIEEHPLEYQRLGGGNERSQMDIEAHIPSRIIVLSGIMGAVVVILLGLLLAASLRAEVPDIELTHPTPTPPTTTSQHLPGTMAEEDMQPEHRPVPAYPDQAQLL
jgi:cytochrome b subunit of formate dehydrogenase